MTDKKISVLIIEDHEATLKGLIDGLSSQPGIAVTGSATSSDVGLKLAKELSPDVILLDLHLPGSAGPKSMTKEFCAIDGSRVIVFSAESRIAFIQTVMQMGAVGYLLKSESIATVADAIHKVMAGTKPIISSEIVLGTTKVTKSEEEVLKMLARGMKYQDMADKRSTSPGTIRKQCEILLLKLGLGSREELISWAVQNGYAGLELEV